MQFARSEREARYWAEVLLYLGGCLLCVCLGGCGQSGPQRVAVAGTVQVDGQPLAAGTVQFIPTGDTRGQAASAAVKDGRFELPRVDGPLKGTQRVEVIVQKDIGFAIDDDAAFAKASQNGRVPIAPTNTAVAFRDPSQQQMELAQDMSSLQFDLVSQPPQRR